MSHKRANAREAKKRQERLFGVLLDVLLFAVPFGWSSMPVTGKFVLWSLAWAIGLYLAFETFGIAGKQLPIARLLVAVGITLVAAGVAYTPARDMWRTEKASETTGLLSLAVPRMEILQHASLEIGDSGAGFLWAGPTGEPMLDIVDDAKLRLDMVDGVPLLSVEVRDRSDNLVVEVIRNRWHVVPQQSAGWNYTNDRLEVKDSRGRVVLQVRLLADRVQLQGEWWNQFRRGLRVIKSDDPAHNGGLMKWLPQNEDFRYVEPVFEYPSSEHWGELRKTPSSH